MRESLLDCKPRAREMGWNWKRIRLIIGIDDVANRMRMYDNMLVGYLGFISSSSTTISDSLI